VPAIDNSRGGMWWWERGGALGLALLLSLYTGIARAQDTPLKPATPEVSTTATSGTASGSQPHRGPVAKLVRALLAGTIRDPAAELFSGLFPEATSGGAQTTENLRPFLLTLPQANLLGEWWGLRAKLEDMGITPTLTYVTDIAGNVTGGKNQGAAYADNIGLNVLFDLDKLVGLEGGSFLVSMSQRDGSSLSQTHVGNVFTIQQDYGGQTFKIIDLAYQQKLLDDRVELRLGRIAAGDDFLVSPYDYLFMQNGFDGNPVGIFFNSPGMTAYPNSSWGALVKVKPTERTYIMGGVYNGDPSIRDNYHSGLDLSMDGPVFAIGEMGYRLNGLPGDSQLLGNYKAGFWYDNSNYTNYRTGGSNRGNWGFYGLFDQVLYPFAKPGSNRGFGVFGSVLVSPDESISQLPYFFTGGFAFRGICESRPTDTGGFGVIYGDFSSDLRDAQEQEQALDPGFGVQNHELVMELTYRFYFRNSALFFQPDLQYVIRPGGTGNIEDALVLGCQIGVNF
jgi:porin